MPLRQGNIQIPVTQSLTQALTRTISPERWKTYQRSAGFNEELAHRLYIWNAAIGQSFHFPLQTVEVSLRNSIHNALVALHGADWATSPDCRAILKTKQVNDITKAERRHVFIYKQTASTPQIVASLSLGFWAAMLRTSYSHKVWSTQAQMAFPNLSNGLTVNDISHWANKIQVLRNRIFHQEPLIGSDLSGDYGNIIKVLNAICPETTIWMKAYASVPIVLRERPR